MTFPSKKSSFIFLISGRIQEHSFDIIFLLVLFIKEIPHMKLYIQREKVTSIVLSKSKRSNSAIVLLFELTEVLRQMKLIKKKQYCVVFVTRNIWIRIEMSEIPFALFSKMSHLCVGIPTQNSIKLKDDSFYWIHLHHYSEAWLPNIPK